jgi:single-strand DNA-binding protein
MASVNKVILVGNLGADPEIRYAASSDAIVNFRLATTDRYKDKVSGEMKEATEWHRCSAFGRAAEVLNEHLRKGSSVYLEGAIRTRKYQAQDGTDRYSTEIRIENFQFLGGGRSNGEGRRDDAGSEQRSDSRGAGRPARQPAGTRNTPVSDYDDDQIPF